MHRKSGWLLVALVALLLGSVVTMNLTMLFLASTDPSIAIEEDYYTRALTWDQRLAQERINAALGWSIELELRRAGSVLREADIEAILRDREGAPLDAAKVRLKAFHGARARWKHEARLARRGSGLYATRLPLVRAGLWEFRFEVTRGDERFTSSLRRHWRGLR